MSLEALFLDPNFAFMRTALLLGIIASIPFGAVGSLVVARRITYLAGATAHSVLGGIGAALYLRHAVGWTWVHPMMGAMLAGILSALLIGWVSIHFKEREDTVIGALWAIGMAVGLIFIFKTPAYVDPMSYLFGDILLVSGKDLGFISLLSVIIGLLILLTYRALVAICFDDEFALLRGVPTHAIYLLLLCLTAITIVLLVSMVGVVMVIALLTLPAAAAGVFSHKLWQMMLGAIATCMLANTTGILVSYPLDLPAGPVIILVAGSLFLAAFVLKRIISH